MNFFGKDFVGSYKYFLQTLNAYAKKWNIFKHFAKREKVNMFANIYHSQFESHQVLRYSTDLEY
jgi:hypothetical protein